MSAQLCRYNTDLFTRKVLPQIKDLFEDQWEDKWWPQPMERKARVMPQSTFAAPMGVAAQ
jgi:hypothetical protein